MNLQLFCYTMDEPLDGLLTTREPLAMRSGAGRDPGSCTICELSVPSAKLNANVRC